MSTQIFITVTTTDLERTKGFYNALGWRLNPELSDDNGVCFVVDEGIYLMVLRREFFSTLTDKQFADPRTHAQALHALGCDSREAVDAIVERGVAAGGSAPGEPQDYGFMYARDLEDPDGNGIQFHYMVPDAVADGPQGALAEHGQSA